MFFRKNLSFIAIFFILLWQTLTVANYKAFKAGGQWTSIKHDQFAYYVFLPATFIYGDLQYGFLDKLPENNPNQIFYPTVTPEGKKVNKVTMGMAIMLSPAFAIAHNIAKISEDVEDGFSKPYRMALFISALLYQLLALLLLRKVLSRYYDDAVIALTLLCVTLGTNLFFYTVHEPAMAHGYNFFLFSLFLFLTLRWYDTKKMKFMIGLGFTLGLIALVRPTNIIIGLFFLLFDVGTLDAFYQRLKLLVDNWLQVLLATICSISVFFPQLYLWKQTTGHWVFNSYGENERFYWSSPALYEGLLGFCKGWFVYTPMMFLAILGFIFVKKYAKQFFLPLILFTIINVYVILSWWSWWYGGGFGLRAFVESAAPLTLCLAAIIAYIKSLKIKALRLILLLPFVFFIALNLFQTFQYKRVWIRWNGMTEEMYWRVFLRYDISGQERDEIFNLAKEPSRAE